MIRNKIYLFPLIAFGITTISGIIASTSTTSAEDITPIDDEVTITVDSACTMGQTTLSTNPTLNPGETGTIGASRIAAYCNDANGYDIYAIGYTNGEYGNTNMTNTTGSTIPTGLSGTGSYWNMQLTPGTSTATPSYIPTITNNFTTPSTIPNDFTKVATYPSTTIPQSEDPLSSGSYFTTTYASHISTTQPAGVYTGQVQYVMVHPVGAPKPEIPYTMQNTAPIKRKLISVGDSLQATDTRDGKTYWVTREADGNIWMTQNLDLDIVAGRTYTSADTDLPENTTWVPNNSTLQFVGEHVPGWESSNTKPYSADKGEIYYYTEYGSYRGATKYYSLAECEADGLSDCEHYHGGNYYNWSAAVASNDTGAMSQNEFASKSICPAGWRLPTNRNPDDDYSDDFYILLRERGSILGEPTSWGGYFYEDEEGSFKLMQEYPMWLVLAGDVQSESPNPDAHSGEYWSNIAKNDLHANKFAFMGVVYPNSYTGRSYGLSVRCIAR